MSSRGDRTAPTSNTPIQSPLANAPKFSPPTSRTESPRGPLRERSNSQSNRDSGSTIRIITEDPEPSSSTYSKTPFPTQNSQIFPGRKRPGYGALEGRGRVSSSGIVANAIARFEQAQASKSPTVSPPLQHPRAVRHSTSTSISDADTIVAPLFSPDTSRFSQGSTAPSSIYTPVEEKSLGILEEEAPQPEPHTIRAVPPSRDGNGIRAVPPSRDGPSEEHALTPRASVASLASTASADSFVYRPTTADNDEPGPSENIHTFPGSSDNSSTENILAFPASSSNSSSSGSGNFKVFRRGHRRSASACSTPKRRSSFRSRGSRRTPHARASSESVAYSDASPNADTSRSSSNPSPVTATPHAARHITLAGGVRLQYPVVRPPSGSSIWAEPRILPKNPARMNPRIAHVHQWSSQLSTIASESERASRSTERISQSPGVDGRSPSVDEYPRDYPRDGRSNIPRRRETISSIESVEEPRNDSSGAETQSTVPVPRPLFSPTARPSSEDRNSDELQDTVAELQSPPLKLKRSFLRRSDSDSARSSRSNSSRPGSAQSDLSTFIHNTIPPWARLYYSRGSRTSLGAPMSTTESTESLALPTATSGRTNTPSESNFPLSIYRPRNRPHVRAVSNTETVSVLEGPEMEEQQVYVIGSHRRPLESSTYTPRLRQDRRSQARLSAWKAPSLDESLGRLFFSRQNRQISLFCLGFIFPVAWIIASFLRLPDNPELATPTPSQLDVERQFVAQGFGPVDDRSYRKAMWWRNLNRIMAALGTLLIGVIIALAILASRMS